MVQGRAVPSGSTQGPQGKFLFYCLKLNVGIQLPHSRVAPPPGDPSAGLVQDRLASASPLPRPQARQAGSRGCPTPTGHSPEWPGPARVKNCSAAGGGDLSPPASATSAMPAAVPSPTLTLLAPKEQWSEWCPMPKRLGAAPLPAQGSFRHATDTSWQNCCQLGLQCLDLVLPNW